MFQNTNLPNVVFRTVLLQFLMRIISTLIGRRVKNGEIYIYRIMREKIDSSLKGIVSAVLLVRGLK